jgi:hypothetical protein
MPRPKKLRPSSTFRVYMPEDVQQAMDARLVSPLTGRLPYDARNTLITALVEQWLEKGEGK